ncbi:MAG: 23S rRNA (uracil(1939)-C(5))-methyltransferase RlmD [Terracidiphilus sp.]
MKRRKPPNPPKPHRAPSLRRSSGARVGNHEPTPAVPNLAEISEPVKGTGFSPYINPPKSERALAPEGKPAQQSQLVEIAKPIYGGSFLARVEGKAVFVPLTLPGEQVRIRVTDDKRGYSTAEPEEILAPSPLRVAPHCPHFGSCGGCHYQHTGYETQLAFKQAILRETLARAGVQAPEIRVLSANPQSRAWAYRNRIRLAFDEQGDLGYRGRRSHAVVPVRECPIAPPLLVQAALASAEIIRGLSWSPRPTEISFFCNADESALLASASTTSRSPGRFVHWAEALQARIPELKGAELIAQAPAGKHLRTVGEWTWGSPSLNYRAAGFDYRIDRGAFFQVNRWLVDALVDYVTAGQSGKLAWDLFAGVGLFARKLTASFARVIAVESAPASRAALEHNLQGTTGEAVHAETLAFLRRRSKEKTDLIVVDPPRTGLGPEITTLLAEIAAPRLVYVSCDPATLARDLRPLLASGYQIQSLTLADLFPQTFHLETIVHLRHS